MAWGRKPLSSDAQGHRRDPARTDDVDHIHLPVDNNPKVPSRIAALIEGTGSVPHPAIIEMAERLEVGRIDVLADRLRHRARLCVTGTVR